MERLVSIVGLFAMIGIAWCFSTARWRINLRVVFGGIFLQILFAVLILKTSAGEALFRAVGDFFNAVLVFSDEGAGFLFNIFPRS
ncbi:MAG: hypothetical protein KDA42_15045, partial [Planctomycetales bacterium]|nr:hypothetical protein [Planctomycetales bacterium]